MVNNRSKAAAICLALCSIFIYTTGKFQEVSAEEKLNRNQIMLLNLKTAPESSGYYIIQSFRTSKEIINSLEKALTQLAAVDQNYAKYRGRPDDRFLQAASLKVTLARQTAQDLEQQLTDAYAELKSSVDEALITDEKFPAASKTDIKIDNKKDKHKKDLPGKVKDFIF